MERCRDGLLLEVVEMSWNTIGMMCSDQMAI
jgi:hypothetical protein